MTAAIVTLAVLAYLAIAALMVYLVARLVHSLADDAIVVGLFWPLALPSILFAFIIFGPLLWAERKGRARA